MSIKSAIGITAGTAALALGACGGDDDESSGGGGAKAQAPVAGEIRLAAVGTSAGIAFDREKVVTKAGPTRIVLDNQLGRSHNVRIQTGKRPFAPGHKDVGGTPTIQPGAKGEGIVDLKPGRYVFVCSIGGHWRAGQQGTLVVQ